MSFKNRIKNRFKFISLFLVAIIITTNLIPNIIVEASTSHIVEVGGLSAKEWNSMSESEIDAYFNIELYANGVTGVGVSVGGWTNGASSIMIPPIRIDGQIGYCMQPLLSFPVNVYYGDPSVSTNVKLRSVVYHGYPNNGSKLKEKHNLSNTQAEQYTQFAVWKILGYVGPGLTISERTHPYVDELVSLANKGDIGPYTSMEFKLSKNTLEAIRYEGYQETEAIGTSGTPGTFTFPSTNEVWSVDLNGNKKNTFNIGESFKIRSTSNFNGIKSLSIKASLGNPNALVYSGNSTYQDILKFSWGNPVEKLATVNVKFTALGNINLHKTNDKGLNLEGVKFGLYSDKEAKNLIKESTTNSDGNIIFSDLNEGTYYIKELATLEGHILSNEIKEVKVVAGTTNKFEWINETIKSKVKFFKYDEDTNKPMANVEFKIEAITGLDKGKVWTVITDETGFFEEELAYGEYEITEVKTLEGYILNTEPIKFEVKESGQIIELSMSNKRIKSEVKLLKLDSETGLQMPNVKFNIKALSGLEQGQTWEVFSDEFGYISMELPYGDYEITEVETLEGYVLNSTPIEFSITENGQVIELFMENDRVKGNAELLKVDSDTKEPLSNVVFELECLEGFNQGSKVELVSDSTGIIKMSDLQYGKYRLTEIKTVEGYVLDSIPIEFEIRNHGETVNLVMENRKVKGKLEIIKVDANSSKRLQGAEFGIYDKDKNLIEVITTDENGSATSSELTYGHYYYRELKSPEGYVVDGNFYEFKIEEDNIVKVIKFKNYPVITYNKTIKPNKWNKTYNSTIPNTGDSMNVGLSLLALLASGFVIITTLRKRK